MFKGLRESLEQKSSTRALVLLLVLVLLSAYFTFPIWLDPGRYSVTRGGDAEMNTWILCWSAREILRDPLNLYNGNIFFPEKNTIAFSDNLLASSILALPVYLATHNPVLVYNFVLYASLFLAGIGMYLLAYRLTGVFYAALIAAVIYDFGVTRMSRMSQIQLFTVHWAPFALLYLHKFFDKQSLKNLLLLALFFLLQAITAAYNAVYLATAIAIGIVFFSITEKKYREGRFYFKLLLLALVTFLAIYPFFLPYVENVESHGMVRSTEAITKHSPRLLSYFVSPAHFYRWFFHLFGLSAYMYGERPFLFPGIVPVALGFYGIWRKKIGHIQVFYLIVGLFALIASTGSKLPLYDFLYRWFLIFQLTRVPTRFVLIGMLCLSALSAYGIAALLRRYREKGRLLYLVVLIATPVVFIVESSMGPVEPFTLLETLPEVYRWVDKQKGDFVITELPMSGTRNARYEFYSIFHWKTLTNGYSGYIPHSYFELSRKLESFPDQESLRRLSERTDYVIVHSEHYDPPLNESLIQRMAGFSDRLKLVRAFGKDYLYKLEIDISGTSFRRYYPAASLLKNNVGFEMVSLSADGDVSDVVSILINGQEAEVLPLYQNFERYLVSIPEKIIQRGPNRIDFVYSYKRARSANPGEAYRIGGTGVFSPVDILVESLDEANQNIATIYVNGKDYSPASRGYNIVVLHPGTGTVESATGFDTFLAKGGSRKMAAFLQQIPRGRIVLAASRGKASRELTPDAVAALKTIGAERSLLHNPNCSHAIIGVKGAEPGQAAETISRDILARQVVGADWNTMGFRMKKLEVVPK